MAGQKNILICPLEWGLGHAGRMIALASKLREMNCNIFFGAGEKHLSFLRNELPGCNYISFPGFSPGYSGFLPQYIVLFLKIPLLLYHIITEHKKLDRVISEYRINIVISDNRFGLWNRRLKTVYVTHQLLIPLPGAFSWLEPAGVILHRMVIRRYSMCFIPDLPGDLNISGRLTHGIKLQSNTRFTGILSRFAGLISESDNNPVNFRHNTVILSGPEPQREILGTKLSVALKEKEFPTVILGGRPDKPAGMTRFGGIIHFNHLPGSALKEVITSGEGIVARSGYTTLMELISLNCSALLIPTPGQPEQEYLARHLAGKGWFTFISQRKIAHGIVLPGKDPRWSNEIVRQSSILLEKALHELLEKDQEDTCAKDPEEEA